MEIIEVLSVRRYKAGYEVREEVWEHDGDRHTGKAAYTPSGDYIGSGKWAYRLAKRWGIVPEKISPENNVCSIGFSESEQRWFGWSHRAIFGFGIGYVVEEDALVADTGWTDEWLAMHPEDNKSVPVGFEAKTLDDCKRLAIAFADAVG